MPEAEVLSNLTAWSPVIQAVCTLLSVAIALITVVVSWRKLHEDRDSATRAIESADMKARQRAIIDLLIAQKSNRSFISASKVVRGLRENTRCQVSTYVSSDNDTRSAILSVLNQLEFIAVGIRLDVFDEAIYKELSYSNVVETWRTVSGFVCELRRQTGFPTLFQDLENLAKKWEKDPIKRI